MARNELEGSSNFMQEFRILVLESESEPMPRELSVTSTYQC